MQTVDLEAVCACQGAAVLNCLATKRSSSLDNSVKLEMGLYDLASAVSRSGFFRRGVMYADLNKLGRVPYQSIAT